ncbi:MAG: hypothetical protein IPP52_04120 [Ignavibacteria bacterium]|nr:hypothetical protein [Ignavibacteria bacterium]
MKYLSILFSLLALTFYSSCGSDSTGNNGGIGPGGGGTGSVTFTMQGQANGANYSFYFQPSVDVKVSRIIANLPAQPYSDTIIQIQTQLMYSVKILHTPGMNIRGYQQVRHGILFSPVT